jgi:NADP-dependent 3-hydroxy acid dehydrogenase YdfG
MNMSLEHKNAIIYGGAVARAFARDGARVFLTGRDLDALDTLAKDMSGARLQFQQSGAVAPLATVAVSAGAA